MKSFISANFLIFTIILIVTFAEISKAELEQNKNRRGASSLVPFPRVGRSDPSFSNALHEAETAALYESMYPTSLEEYEEEPKSENKRASLIAFPRVGRTDAEIRKLARFLAFQQALDKRAGPSAASSLWFGPRLGKRSVDKATATSKGQKEQLQ